MCVARDRGFGGFGNNESNSYGKCDDETEHFYASPGDDHTYSADRNVHPEATDVHARASNSNGGANSDDLIGHRYADRADVDDGATH